MGPHSLRLSSLLLWLPQRYLHRTLGLQRTQFENHDVYESLTDEDEETQEVGRLIRQLLVDTGLVRKDSDLLTSGWCFCLGCCAFPLWFLFLLSV